METRSCPASLLVGQRWKRICTVSQGGDFFLSSYVTTFKLHSKTAPDPAFLNPALCLYPHWQPQRMVTTGWRPQAGLIPYRSDTGGVWTALWEHSRLLDGTGQSCCRPCGVLPVRCCVFLLQCAPSVCSSPPWSCHITCVQLIPPRARLCSRCS